MSERNELTPNYQEVSMDLGDGRTISIETGRFAKLADGAVVVKCGNTMLLATVVSAKEPREGIDFFPLSVDYQEKYAAAGRIPGGFFKREGKLSDYEVLTSRLIDRAIRPLFPDHYRNETQIMVTLISADKNVMPDSLAALAASAAIAVSDIPFNGPISEVRVARINGEYVINPSRSDLEKADLDMMVGATPDNLLMIEGEMKEISEEEMIDAIQFAHEAIKKQCSLQLELAAKVGASEKREVIAPEENEEIKQRVETFAKERIYSIVRGSLSKFERREQLKQIKTELVESFGEEPEESDILFAERYYKELEKKIVRDLIIDEGVRLDGRKPNEIRPLWMEVDFLPSAHGSAVFTRGETQSLTSVTLGTRLDEQMIDEATFQGYNKFLLHYNFPAFSTGEVKPNRGPGRREVGHGNLALRSLKQVMPPVEENPYTVRVVSDILESNGSSSMATVCAGSLALMDAGIQITGNVSGIAMGLISREDGKIAILSDILGDEDHLGDMDFKVTGTAQGICGCQMDIKIEGLSAAVMKQALDQAREGRLHILNEMNKVMSTPRGEFKPHVPRMEKMFIAKEFIGAIIGPGGKVIQEMQKETGTVIMIEEVGDQGEIVISGDNKEAIDRAVSRIKSIVAVPSAGEVYEAKVKSIMPYGAFVEFMPGKEGLLHISEVSWKRLESMEGILKEGDVVKVKLMDIDKKTGKFKLSRKALLEKPAFKEKERSAAGDEGDNQGNQ